MGLSAGGLFEVSEGAAVGRWDGHIIGIISESDPFKWRNGGWGKRRGPEGRYGKGVWKDYGAVFEDLQERKKCKREGGIFANATIVCILHPIPYIC